MRMANRPWILRNIQRAESISRLLHLGKFIRDAVSDGDAFTDDVEIMANLRSEYAKRQDEIVEQDIAKLMKADPALARSAAKAIATKQDKEAVRVLRELMALN